ncbi:unnamed protein product, partial [Mesorhabditis belari]|uniref:Uncharacterized protein n=1 Tax=Mesorhabditis belari TaxID=2138241 RepID=A0AAF3EK78_9BILA
MYLIDMIMAPNQMVQKDASNNCYFISQIKGIVKDTLNGLDDSVGVAFLTYYQPPDSPSITVLMSRQDALVYVDTLAGNTPMYNGANEMVAINLLEKMAYITELVHFVPCAPMKTGMSDTAGLFSKASLQKLILISSDLTEDQVKNNYALSDSKDPTLIVDMNFPPENILQYLKNNLPPIPPTTTTTATPSPSSTYNVTFSMYLIDMIMDPNQMLQKDASYNCYFISQMKGIVKDTLNGLDDSVGVAFLTYYQPPDSPSITVLMSRQDALVYVDTLAGNTPMYNGANEMAAMSLFDKTNYVSELVHFVPCEPMRMDGASGLFSSTSLEKLVLISSDLNQDQIISNYNLPNDSRYSTLILDKDVPKENISNNLEHNLPPDVATTPSTEQNPQLYHIMSPTTTITTTPVPLIPCQALFIADASDAVSSIRQEAIISQVSAQNLFNDPTLQFTAAVWSYGDYSQIGDLPESFVNTTVDFNALSDALYKTGGTDDVKFAATKVNAWDKTNTVIVLFTASPQSAINDASKTYQRFSATVGISTTANDMSPLAAFTVDFSNPAGIPVAIRQTCVNLLSATTTTAESTTTAGSTTIGTTGTGEISTNSSPLLTVPTETLSSRTSTAESFSSTPFLSTASSLSHSTGTINASSFASSTAFSIQSTAFTETLAEFSSAKSSQATSAFDVTSSTALTASATISGLNVISTASSLPNTATIAIEASTASSSTVSTAESTNSRPQTDSFTTSSKLPDASTTLELNESTTTFETTNITELTSTETSTSFTAHSEVTSSSETTMNITASRIPISSSTETSSNLQTDSVTTLTASTAMFSSTTSSELPDASTTTELNETATSEVTNATELTSFEPSTSSILNLNSTVPSTDSSTGFSDTAFNMSSTTSSKQPHTSRTVETSKASTTSPFGSTTDTIEPTSSDASTDFFDTTFDTSSIVFSLQSTTSSKPDASTTVKTKPTTSGAPIYFSDSTLNPTSTIILTSVTELLSSSEIIPILLWSQVLGDSCNVLFVVDGSSYWNSFRGEIVSISTVANILYSTTNFTSNFWMYGDDPQDDRIPTSFYSTEQDFLDDIQELSTYGGKETVVGATSKLNDWQTYALIVIYTASSQTLINVAGANYTEQSRTVAIHQNDGIDLRPISNYPSYEISNYTNIVDVITNACKHFPMKTTTPKTQPTTTTTLKASTSTSARPQSTVSPSLPSSTTTAPFAETTSTYSTESVPSTELFSSTSPELASTTTPIPPPCPVFFYIDGSAAKTVIDQQINLTETVASSMYQSYEWRFLSSVSAFGQLIIGDPDPNTLIDNFPAFEATLDLLDFSSPSGDVTSAIDTMNGDSDFGNVLTILFVAAPQPRIDGANANLYKDFTYGIGMIGKQNLTRLSYDSDDYTTDNGTTLQQAINNFCANFPAMAPSPQTVPTVSLTTSTTTPIPIVKTLFVIDGSSLAGSIVSQRLFLQSLARVAFGRMDMVFSANIWEYGDDSKDEAIPITFIDNLNDVDDAITFQQSYGGKENIIGATGKLNDWPIFDGVIVLITASPDNLIDMVSYFKRNQTVAMSTHDGVEMSAITDYPHTISSPYADVLDDIRKVALNLAPSTTVLTGSTRTGPTTIGSSFVVKRLTDYGHLIRKPRHTYDTCTQPTYGLHRIRRQNFLDP